MFDFDIILAIIGAYLLGGIVKGVIGLGLPTVSLALLAVLIDLQSAMALLVVPSIITNIAQFMEGSGPWVLIKRLWPFFMLSAMFVWLGVNISQTVDSAHLLMLLGLILLSYATLNLAGIRFVIPQHLQNRVGIIAGILNGIASGLTGSAVLPGIMYLQSLNLKRDEFIKAMGLLFFISILALGFALRSIGVFTLELGIYSAFALIPGFIGMILGKKVRSSLSEQKFKQIFFIFILFLGIYIVLHELF